MYSQHHRFQIWSTHQHPYNHSPYEFGYTHDGLPGVTNMGATLDWILAVLYPNNLSSVATPGDLPAAGNNINDYRVVSDDGDGKAASYRWEQREGDPAAKWYKIYDMDWGEQTVLSNFLNITQDVYAYKPGMDDLDSDGNAYVGDLAGQRIYGGASATTNLLLYANSGDGTGANTGSIFAGDKLSPLVDDTFTLGESGKRWSDVRASLATIANIAISASSIISDSGSLAFGANDLSTTGTYAAGSLTLGAGSITDSSGAIDFNDENLTTTGDITAETASFQLMQSPNITQLGGVANVSAASNLFYTSNVSLNNIQAQVFVPTATGDLTQAMIKINVGDFDGTMTLKIRTASGLTPDGGAGSILATSDAISLPTVGAGYQDVIFTFSTPLTLTSGVAYALEVNNETVGTGTNFVYFGSDSGENYVPGNFYYSNNGGVSFSIVFGRDLYFDLFLSAAIQINGVVHAVNGVYGASNVVNADVDAAAAIEMSKLEALAADRAVLTDGSGVIAASAVTATELGYLDGVTSSIQTQFSGKADTNLGNLSSPTAINQSLTPTTNNSRDLGTSVRRWQDLYLSDSIRDNTNAVSVTNLVTLRNAYGTVSGQTLFWDHTTRTWEPSNPDDEIDHNTIANLDVGDVHTQYAYLNGRATGQTLIGSYTSNEYLTLAGAASSGAGELDSSYEASNVTMIPGGLQYAQSFTATTSLNISSAVFKLYNNVSATGNVVIKLLSVSGSTPVGLPGGLLATSDPIDAATIPASATEITFTFTGGPALAIGTKYCVYMDISGLSTEIGHTLDNGGATYPGGSMHFTVNSGTSFNSGYADRDLWFKVYTSAGAVTSGGVRIQDNLYPDADLASRDIGSASLRWQDLFMSGEVKGGRIENVLSTGLPASSGLNIGRMYYATDSKDLMIDTGTTLQRLSQENIVIDDTTGWTGTEVSVAYNVSASIEDATKAIWAFYDVSDGYKEIKGAELSKSLTQVTVNVDIALPAGTYRLVGIR